MLFLWLKAFHIIFVVCWFACLFYLPRLFVNHAMVDDETTHQRLCLMERKLFRFSIPFAVLTIAFGAGLVAYNPNYYLNALWFQFKLVLIVLLIAYHAYCGHLVRLFQRRENRRSHRFYRLFNELPVLVLFGAIILAVVKPWV